MDDNDLQEAIKDSNWTEPNGVQANSHATKTVNGQVKKLAEIADDNSGKLPLHLACDKFLSNTQMTNGDLTNFLKALRSLIAAYPAATQTQDNEGRLTPFIESDGFLLYVLL